MPLDLFWLWCALKLPENSFVPEAARAEPLDHPHDLLGSGADPFLIFLIKHLVDVALLLEDYEHDACVLALSDLVVGDLFLICFNVGGNFDSIKRFLVKTENTRR